MSSEENKPTNTSVNRSLLRQDITCNHCSFKCETAEKMKEHYRSDFHKYNLNRVTMNLAPISYEEYMRKKQIYLAKQAELEKAKANKEKDVGTLFCDVCSKKFSSRKKLEEHLKSKLHLKKAEELKSKEEAKKKNEEEISTNSQKKEEENKKEEKTTIDDISICLFCNEKSENLEKNIYHMINIHRFDVPFLFCIKNYKAMITLIAKKIFTYKACLTCDSQKFQTIKALQNHMIDKCHTRVNNDDLDEFLYKYYDTKKLFSLKDPNWRKMKEFKILSLRTKVAKQLKEEEEEEWEEEDEENEKSEENKKDEESKKGEENKKEEENKKDEDSDNDYDPLTLPNGELLLEDGTILGNKIYNIYYKQRIRINRYESLQKEMRKNLKNKRGIYKNNTRKNKRHQIIRRELNGSNKANFQRVNSLFVAREQVVF